MILVFDDLLIDDPHETAPLDPKCPSRRGTPKDSPRKVPDMTHSPAAAPLVTAQSPTSILKSGKVTNAPSKKALIASRPRNTFSKAISQYSAFSAKRLRNNAVSCVLQALAHRLTHRVGCNA